MRKYYIRLLLVICLILSLSACGANSQEKLSVADDTDYTRITTNNGEDFYVDDKVVQVDDTQAVDAKKITDAVESYVLTVLDGPYRGRIGVVDGDFISAPGLEQELDARIKYIAATEKIKIFQSVIHIYALKPLISKTTVQKSLYRLN